MVVGREMQGGALEPPWDCHESKLKQQKSTKTNQIS
jgi:hypothetical protein